MTAVDKAKYPDNPWGPLVADPCSDVLDVVIGKVWDDAVESSRQMRLASARTHDSLVRLEKGRQIDLARAQKEVSSSIAG